MKTELFDLVNRNYRAIRYIESKPSKNENIKEMINLSLFIIGAMTIIIVTLLYSIRSYSCGL